METHLADLCDYLADKGHQISVITYHPAFSQPHYRIPLDTKRLEIHGNIEIHRILSRGFFISHLLPRLSGTFFEFLYFVPGLLAYSFVFMFVNYRKIDVIHAHGLASGLVGSLLSMFFRRRCIMSVHWIAGLDKRRVLRNLTRVLSFFCEKILTLSIASKSEMIRAGIDSKKIVVFRYWVDQELFKPINKNYEKTILGFEGHFVVLFVGRLIKEKGIHLLVEIAKRFDHCGGNMLFLVAGDGPLRHELNLVQKKVKTLRWIGRLSNRDLSHYYGAADIVVVPSTHEEGFGRVILEALSCGTPVVASKKGGIPEALDPSVGFALSPQVSTFVTTINILLQNPSLLKQMTEACRPYAERQFSLNNAKLIEETLRHASRHTYGFNWCNH